MLFSIIFTITAGIVTSAQCSYRFALKHLLMAVAGAILLWVLGGLAAMGLATLSPEFYRDAFIGVPDDFEAMLRYAWVGGSIWGVQFGGFFALIVALVILRGNWLLEIEVSGEGSASAG